MEERGPGWRWCLDYRLSWTDVCRRYGRTDGLGEHRTCDTCHGDSRYSCTADLYHITIVIIVIITRTRPQTDHQRVSYGDICTAAYFNERYAVQSYFDTTRVGHGSGMSIHESGRVESGRIGLDPWAGGSGRKWPMSQYNQTRRVGPFYRNSVTLTSWIDSFDLKQNNRQRDALHRTAAVGYRTLSVVTILTVAVIGEILLLSKYELDL